MSKYNILDNIWNEYFILHSGTVYDFVMSFNINPKSKHLLKHYLSSRKEYGPKYAQQSLQVWFKKSDTIQLKEELLRCKVNE